MGMLPKMLDTKEVRHMANQGRGVGFTYWQGIIGTAFASLWNNKLRSTLAVLGLVIGIAAIVIIRSLGNGLTSQVTTLLSDFGGNVLFIMPGSLQTGFGAQGTSQTITYEDYEFIRSTNLSSIESVVPSAEEAVVAKNSRNKTTNTYAIATSAAYFQTINTPLQIGRYFTTEEERSGYNYAVVGSQLADDLWDSREAALGQQVTVKGTSYLVVGVAEEISGGAFGSANNAIYLPYQSARQSIVTSNELSTIYVKVTPESIDYTKYLLQNLLQKFKNTTDEERGFSVITQEQILESTNQILGILTGGLSAIAAISLVVGGIGIMNIMLVSVVERTREIGVRRALGATQFDILVQFLLEAITLTGVGGLLGSLAGLGLATLVAHFLQLQATLSINDTVLISVISAVIGIIFGSFPAWRAARLDPVEALRYE